MGWRWGTPWKGHGTSEVLWDGDGVNPPPPGVDRHTPVKTVPFRRTTYAGGNEGRSTSFLVARFMCRVFVNYANPELRKRPWLCCLNLTCIEMDEVWQNGNHSVITWHDFLPYFRFFSRGNSHNGNEKWISGTLRDPNVKEPNDCGPTPPPPNHPTTSSSTCRVVVTVVVMSRWIIYINRIDRRTIGLPSRVATVTTRRVHSLYRDLPHTEGNNQTDTP